MTSTEPPSLPARRAVRRRRRLPGPPTEPAPVLPVARVAVDISLPHLDRPFDYLVTTPLDDVAVPGCRVRVRFAGRLVDGFLLERSESSAHPGRLQPLARVVSPEPVLTAETAALARAVADRYAGTLADVLRLAVPPRHAAAEAEPGQARLLPPGPPEPGEWGQSAGGREFLQALAREQDSPRAVWSALPGTEWPDALARAVAATLAAGRGALAVVPDRRDVDRLDAAITALVGRGRHTVLTADLGPKERYRRWLTVLRGQVPAVIGTRAAAFAPVPDLGLAAIWDDGDDLHDEPRAPYPHVREVLALRAHLGGSGLLVAGHARTAEASSLVATGYARSLAPPRAVVRAAAPRVTVVDDGTVAGPGAQPLARGARLPTAAWRIAHRALRDGPVLVQVPRRGYLPAMACHRCRTRAACPVCGGPLALPGRGTSPSCRWCGRADAGWRCPQCGGERLRASAIGSRRTAEELGRAFPSVPVLTSGGTKGVLAEVADRPSLVVATPGAEPVAAAGYTAALLLDAWALLGRPDLRAGEETLRRWLAASALVRPAPSGGRVVVVADPAARPVQALVRWDPVGFAERERADREATGLPPAARVALLRGSPDAVDDLLHRARLPDDAQLLGPVPDAETGVRALVRVPRRSGAALASALRAAAGERSAHKAADPVTVHIDPVDLG